MSAKGKLSVFRKFKTARIDTSTLARPPSGFDSSFSPAYVHHVNGIVERFMRTLRNSIVTLYSDTYSQHNRDLHISVIAFAYNTHIHDDLGESPFYLRFGGDLRLPIDFVLSSPLDSVDAPIFSTADDVATSRPEHKRRL
ncbi:hypothetical protein BCR44DRAFT_69151, partial [Catenaria anguillulae PL171]